MRRVPDVTLCAHFAGATATATVEAASERTAATGLFSLGVSVWDRVGQILALLMAGEKRLGGVVLGEGRGGRVVVVGHVDLDVLGVAMVGHGWAENC